METSLLKCLSFVDNRFINHYKLEDVWCMLRFQMHVISNSSLCVCGYLLVYFFIYYKYKFKFNAQDRYLLESVCSDTGDVEVEKTSASNKTARLVSTLPVAKHREHCGR